MIDVVVAVDVEYEGAVVAAVSALRDARVVRRPADETELLALVAGGSGHVVVLSRWFPGIDADVVALATALPSRHKLLGLDEKHILKRAFADLVPEEITTRPKQPYRSPDAAAFFLGETGSWVEDLTSEDRVAAAGVFEPRAVTALLTKARRREGIRMSNTDNMRVLAVLSLQLIHDQLIVGDGSSPFDRPPAEPMTVTDRATHR